MKKFLMTATVPSMIGQFNMNNIRLLLDMKYEVHVACNFRDRSVWTEERIKKFEQQLSELHVKKIQIEYARTPYNIPKLIKSYFELKKLIRKEKYDGLHCHTPVAGLIARSAAKRAGTKTRVIYTAHGFHFYKGAPVLNWLLYYPIEKWMSRYTDVLITINREDYQRAKRKFHAKEISYVPGVGIDVEKIQSVQVNWKVKRKEIGIAEDDFLLLSVGELNKNKNHEVVIRALAELKNPKIKYVICGQGPLKGYLEDLAEELGVKEQLFLLGFRTDVIEICKSANVFVFPSKREGLSVALMEAMACKLPCVVSKIRGNTDLIKEGKGGYFFPAFSKDECKKKLMIIINNFSIRKTMSEYNGKLIFKYSTDQIMECMKKNYNL